MSDHPDDALLGRVRVTSGRVIRVSCAFLVLPPLGRCHVTLLDGPPPYHLVLSQIFPVANGGSGYMVLDHVLVVADEWTSTTSLPLQLSVWIRVSGMWRDTRDRTYMYLVVTLDRSSHDPH